MSVPTIIIFPMLPITYQSKTLKGQYKVSSSWAMDLLSTLYLMFQQLGTAIHYTLSHFLFSANLSFIRPHEQPTFRSPFLGLMGPGAHTSTATLTTLHAKY